MRIPNSKNQYEMMKSNPEKTQMVIDRYVCRQISSKQAERELGVGRTAFYRYLRDTCGYKAGYVPHDYPESITRLKERIALLEKELEQRKKK